MLSSLAYGNRLLVQNSGSFAASFRKIQSASSSSLKSSVGVRINAVGKHAGTRRYFSKNETSAARGNKEIKSNESTSSSSSVPNNNAMNEIKSNASFWQKWTSAKEMPERGTMQWYKEMVLICTVFGITGSSTMVLVRPAVSNGLGLKGSFRDGPNSFRICSLVVMTPLYASMLVVVGTIFGRHHYFRHFAVKMFSRFGIPPEMMDATFHQTKATFRKW
uniref:DUF6787 domain-containing protein n=1 Tax=Proboscia inermis TaxID=420281 RepID=A0A7S0BUS4_9STRA|mmetsp:Transcript_10691/g.10795  ORF Transcript_10691/g.10795 Transcript_10691/m.10795 type:complete len:219 (+) Transcript_10691:205-861(+)